MSIFLRICFLFFIFVISLGGVQAGFFDDFIDGGSPDIRFCDDDDDCGIDAGIDYVRDGLNGEVVTDRKASEYIQDVVTYLLMFISIVAVIYIIYAGFRILIADGDEEEVKKSKKRILYVMIGIVIIWLAWPITLWFLGVLNN